jgi:hypothetical protein
MVSQTGVPDKLPADTVQALQGDWQGRSPSMLVMLARMGNIIPATLTVSARWFGSGSGTGWPWKHRVAGS